LFLAVKSKNTTARNTIGGGSVEPARPLKKTDRKRRKDGGERSEKRMSEKRRGKRVGWSRQHPKKGATDVGKGEGFRKHE